MSHPSPAVLLNNYLQEKKTLDKCSINYEEEGVQNDKTWKCIIKYEGKVIAFASAKHKIPAKEGACTKALEHLKNLP